MIRLDDLFVHGWKIYQDTDGFCFGTDAILLGSFAGEKVFSTAVDLCCGTGILPLLLASYPCAKEVHGVDVSSSAAELAQRSVALNGIESVYIHCEDLRKTTLPAGRFDLVTANPPYFLPGTGKTSAPAVESARREEDCTFQDVASCAARLLRYGGRFCFVHKPERLAELLSVCTSLRLEPKVLQLIHPRADRSPELILVECKKGASVGLQVRPPFVLYDENGNETPQYRASHRY